MVEKTVLAGRYHLDERIAGGGMGTVFVATDELLRRRVAAKLLREDLVDNPAFVERFRREARAVASLVHPNIAAVYDYGEDAGRHFIVMELVEGEDLERMLRRDGALAPEQARHLTTEVCRALGHAHAAGLVHRDVKPANVIVAPDEHVKVTDFGIARVADETTMTAAGSVLGTARYLSPEQASDREVGPTSDVYSTGIMLFEMLTGDVPFSGSSPVAIAMRHVNEDVPSPRTLNPDIPDDLDRAVVRATARDPARRFPNGDAMASALEGREPAAATAVMGGGTELLPPSRTAEIESPVWPPGGGARRRTAPWAVVAVVVALALLAGAGWAAITSLRRPDEARRAPAATDRPETSPSQTPSPEEQLVAVPSGLVGHNVTAAESVVRDAGLVPARRNVEDDSKEGTVVAVSPPEGTEVAPGATVTLTVSLGPPAESPSPTPSPSPSASASASAAGSTASGQALAASRTTARPTAARARRGLDEEAA